jgi:hypothetical protein
MPAEKTDNNNYNFTKFLFVKHVTNQTEEWDQEPGAGKEASGIYFSNLLQHLGGMNELDYFI